MNRTVTYEELISIFDYNKETGELRLKKSTARRNKPGDLVGGINSRGYHKVKIKYKTHQTSHVCWCLATGSWPKNQIDHINGNQSDNRFINLREASCAENQQNRKMPSTNKIGLIGASKFNGKYKAQITHDGVHHYLGLYGTAEDAHLAYCKAKESLHTFNPSIR